MKQAIRYKDGEELNEDNGLIPQSIADKICGIKKNDRWPADNGSKIKGNWKLTFLLERMKKHGQE